MPLQKSFKNVFVKWNKRDLEYRFGFGDMRSLRKSYLSRHETKPR